MPRAAGSERWGQEQIRPERLAGRAADRALESASRANRISMFLRSRRDCSKVSVPAKERGIPRAVSANALMSARGQFQTSGRVQVGLFILDSGHVRTGSSRPVRAKKRHGSHRKAPANYTAQRPRALTKLASNSDGNPGQQERSAKREHRKSRPIRFDPKAASRSFRFQGVTGSPGAKPPSTT